MALNSPWVLHASQGMLTEKVHCGTAWTLVGLTECTAKQKTDSNTDSTVVEEESTSADRAGVKPVATVRCCGCQKSGSVTWL